jgi:hypothetical protein
MSFEGCARGICTSTEVEGSRVRGFANLAAVARFGVVTRDDTAVIGRAFGSVPAKLPL